MIAEGSLILFLGFAVLLALGAPLAVALGVAGTAVILIEGLGIMSVPTNAYNGIAKYPLLALPVFVLAGMMFERAGVAVRIVRFASAVVGKRRGAQGIVAILVCMFLGGISGSGAADAAAVAMVMIPSMLKQGYPKEFSATLIAAAGSTAILIPPSVALIVYSVLVPSASVPALFAGGVIPGIMAGLALILPTLYLSWKYGWGLDDGEETPKFWDSFKEAIWGLLAPVIILGGLRTGIFTPTEAAVVAAFYGFFVGVFVYRTLSMRKVYEVLVESAEISAVVMLIISLAGVFAHAGSTLGAFDAFAKLLLGFTSNEALMLTMITIMLLIAGMLLDAVSVYLVFLPILLPIMAIYKWDPVWFGIIMTMNMAIGQFTPPMAVNLMVTTRIAGVTMESTVRWAMWMVAAMLLSLFLVTAFPQLALWLPQSLGY
ncbi:TRAP transporter large permease [Noviherbaspirillum sp. CPCC 100848]|uniref:TRAP transporter large permease protein n=1 Tax=Noviherbaspirillum album TaxID=3080276 RepID=A0ABU6J2P2_9BURK|nr:TRAP transporter large permease [Noviherbaspirillum sp. CPCC 100848]MEC4717892.1 TRAP transporter large permease [Noviherbaspirillum sp. CPCC 100848]